MLVFPKLTTSTNAVNKALKNWVARTDIKKHITFHSARHTFCTLLMKRKVDGIYHWVSVPHLQAYVDEFSLRFNTRKYETSQRFNFILANVSGRKLTYENLINKA